jgi:glycosyltransferase involved in cell wall biosynthesis
MQSEQLSKKLKVCVFSGFFPAHAGGAEYQAYLLAKTLRSAGHEVFFIGIGGNESGKYELEGFTVYFLNKSRVLGKLGNSAFLLYPKIKDILSKENPDIVYSRNTYAVPGILAKISNNLKYQFIWGISSDRNLKNSIMKNGIRPFNLIDNYFRIYGIKNAHAIISQTEYQKALLAANFQRESIVIRNAHPVPSDNIAKASNCIQVLFIANCKPFKRPEVFLQLSKYSQRTKNVRFIMIGRSSNNHKFKKELKMAAQDYDNFEYLGEIPQEDVNEYLAKSHLLVNTSIFEGFSNTFIQAWMRKVPVVSLSVDPDKLLSKEGLGYCSGNFESLVDDVQRLIENHKLRDFIGEKARRYAIEHFSIDKVGKQFKDLVESLSC